LRIFLDVHSIEDKDKAIIIVDDATGFQEVREAGSPNIGGIQAT
jgi:hypothetical protein